MTDSELAEMYRRAISQSKKPPLFVNKNGIPVFSVPKPRHRDPVGLKWKMAMPHGMPRVKRKFDPRPAEYPESAWVVAVIERDGHVCCYCGMINRRLTVDHVLPKKLGGQNEMENYVAACKECNSQKADRTPLQWLLSNCGLRSVDCGVRQ